MAGRATLSLLSRVGGGPGFPIEGCANPRGVGDQHTILLNFPKDCMKFTITIYMNNLDHGEGSSGGGCCDIGQTCIGKDVKMTYSPE